MPVTFINSGRFGAAAPSLWLDASDAATITLNGSTVSQWNDKSGNGFHFVQGTATNQPTYTTAGQNGLNCVTFDGVDNFMTCTGAILTAKPSTIVAVSQNSAANGRTCSISNSFLYYNAGGVTFYQGAALGGAGNWTGTNADVVVVITNGASTKLAKNGAAYNTGNSGSDGFTTTNILGANNGSGQFPLTGTICEILCYRYALADADRAVLDAALKAKWGTP